MRNKDGFSLIEVLVALVIIAIMGSVVAINLSGATDEARIQSTQAQLDNFATAMTLFKTKHGFFPTQQQGLDALVQAPTREPLAVGYQEGGYLDSTTIPMDAWGNPYIYLIPGRSGKPYEILSYGADGIEGGEGPNADLSTSN